MKRIFLSLLAFVLLTPGVSAQTVERVEPLSWWVGMKTPLQLLFYGPELSGCQASVLEEGVKVARLHWAESPNYLFADIEIDDDASPGLYTFRFTRKDGTAFDHPYRIDRRREGSALRGSFSSSDLVYLLMPDRFANGDPSNDSTPDTAEKASRSNPHGRHGGDIQGIIDRLGYMQDLGVTALWSTPLLLDDEPVYSYHGYACADYYRIDPRFGTNELYRDMVRQAHEKGIKVILDAVTNHCGTAHWWMSDLPFGEWINRRDTFTRSNHAIASNSDPNASRYDLDLASEGWFDTSMPDMRTQNPFVLNYFRQVFTWWVEWADLDGIRVDTYPYNEKHAMARWTAGMLEEYPNLNIVGECWRSTPSLTAYWDGAARNRDGFTSHLPSVMDFPLQEALCTGLSSQDSTYRGHGMMQIYNSLSQDFLYEEPRRLMIFVDNHDTERFADILEGDPRRVKLGMTLLATLRGVPQLYAGTEMMLRSTDRSEGHGTARLDFPGGWPEDPKNFFENRGDLSPEQRSVFDFTRFLFNWRKSEKVLHEGRTMHFFPQENIYAFFRYTDAEAVFVLVNASEYDHRIHWEQYRELTDCYSQRLTDVLTGQSATITDYVAVPALTSLILKFVK